jgi:hypothetical protein
VYYRVYNDYGAVLSKQPADPSDPSVGRISVDSIPPPQSAISIMRCISKAEELDSSKQSQLFTSISSESAMGEGHVSILTTNRSGFTPEDPMAYVELPTPVTSPMPTLIDAPAPVAPLMPYPKFTKRVRVMNLSCKSMLNYGEVIVLTCFLAHCQQNSGWLAVKKGDILRTTNDLPQLQQYNWLDSEFTGSGNIV